MAEFNDVMNALSVPMGQLIASIGVSVAEAQGSMDRQTIENFKEIYAVGSDAFAEFRSIGYQPTWYAIPEVRAELAIAVSMSGDSHTRRIGATPVDAAYASRFAFNLRGASTLKLKIVPVPPPGAAADLRVVPSVIGMSVGEARTVLEARGLSLALEGAVADDAQISAQQPSAGAVLPRDAGVSVTALEM